MYIAWYGKSQENREFLTLDEELEMTYKLCLGRRSSEVEQVIRNH